MQDQRNCSEVKASEQWAARSITALLPITLNQAGGRVRCPGRHAHSAIIHQPAEANEFSKLASEPIDGNLKSDRELPIESWAVAGESREQELTRSGYWRQAAPGDHHQHNLQLHRSCGQWPASLLVAAAGADQSWHFDTRKLPFLPQQQDTAISGN